ncbi:MAG: peroxiredoxin [Chloroflexota bacterium]|nr:peroxiredoxin [Chloroflexota bacterium]
MPTLKSGDPAPDVTFRTADRQEVSIASFNGKQSVVLAFYPRACTGGCERELRKFQSLLSDFQQLGAQVLGASTDAAPSQKAFADHLGLSFPLVADFPTFAAAKAFGVFDEERVQNSRVTFVIDKQGIIRHVIQDVPNSEIHATESLEALKKLS